MTPENLTASVFWDGVVWTATALVFGMGVLCTLAVALLIIAIVGQLLDLLWRGVAFVGRRVFG